MMPVAMVGRSGELAELAGAWTVVAAGDRPAPRTVVITGVAGVGKSLLVAAALEAFTPRPAAVVAGAARLHTPAPYDWLAAALSAHGDPTGLPVPADALAWLAQLPGAPRERYAPSALLRLAVRTVRALIGTGPAVLVVEDLHALDPASLNLIGEVAAVPDLPVLLVVVSRPPEVAVNPELAARTLARLTGVPGAVRQHLGPLSPVEVAEVLDQVYGDRAASAEVARGVWRRTGGNPYWLTELLAATGGGSPEALLDSPLPGHLRLPAQPVVPTPPAPPVSPAGPVSPVVLTPPMIATPPAGQGHVPVPGPGPAGPAAELTAREVQVLSCLAAGMSNKQIARSLGISVRTVTVHVSNLLRKTGSASRTEAALWALRHQLPAADGVDA